MVLCTGGKKSIEKQAAKGCATRPIDSANGTWSYAYDSFNRLCGANQSTTSPACGSPSDLYTYAYDRFGNRWQQNGPHSSQPGFDANNHMVPGLGITYDAAGNETDDGTTAYIYDAENRIATATNSNSGTSSYVYDSDGRRVQKTTAAGGAVNFLYDIEGNEIAQLNSAGIWTRGEIYAAGRHWATFNNSSVYYNEIDWLGTEPARSVAGATTFCETITSLAFGDWQTTSGSCSDPSPMHFTGKERDSESGLDNFGARYDSSQYGRFMTPDPGNMGADPTNPQSWNMYSYALNNPVSNTDPTGLYTCTYLTDDGNDVESSDSHSSQQECHDTGGQEAVADQQITVNGSDSSSSNDTAPAAFDSQLVNPYITPGAAPARNGLLNILSNSNSCSAFFDAAAKEQGDGTSSSADTFKKVDIRLNPNAPVQTAGESMQGSGANGPIFINPNSAFFKSTGVINGQSVPLNIGPYTGGTLSAQETILAHELGHKVNAIPTDRGSSQSQKNTDTIVKQCGKQIGH